jgi:hypothetical protein
VKLLASLLLLVGCGFNGNQRITTEGETKHRVVVELQFLEQIRKLCEASVGPDPKAVAECTLENLDVLNLSVDGTVQVACPEGKVPPELQFICREL